MNVAFVVARVCLVSKPHEARRDASSETRPARPTGIHQDGGSEPLEAERWLMNSVV